MPFSKRWARSDRLFRLMPVWPLPGRLPSVRASRCSCAVFLWRQASAGGIGEGTAVRGGHPCCLFLGEAGEVPDSCVASEASACEEELIGCFLDE